MPFDSFTFVLFLAIVLALHALLRGPAARKSMLLAASLVFYAGWNPWFLPLLLLTSSFDFWVGRRLLHDDGPRRAGWLALSLASNLAVLAFFKYRFFVAGNLDALLGTQWLATLQADTRAWVLPVGISFYTFQSMSYCIDCYRRQVDPGVTWRDFTLYVAFFPQLVAGPIVRFHDFHPQLLAPRPVTGADRGQGLALLVFGLFLKVCLADALFAPASDRLFGSDAAAPDGWLAATGTIAFSGQIFCDFAGYSTCAIGCARLLGYRLVENFHAPYASIGFSDFWRRWHVSLSSWLRDYLYIPLGGNRHGALRTYGALTLTMLLGGLWHGAAWTFIAWGALHAGYLVVERLLRPALARVALPGAWLAGWLLTLCAVMLAWIFFRAASLEQALHIVGALGNWRGGGLPASQHLVWLGFAGLLAVHGLERRHRLSERWVHWPAPVLALGLGTLLTAVVLSPGNARAFIYFQF